MAPKTSQRPDKAFIRCICREDGCLIGVRPLEISEDGQARVRDNATGIGDRQIFQSNEAEFSVCDLKVSSRVRHGFQIRPKPHDEIVQSILPDPLALHVSGIGFDGTFGEVGGAQFRGHPEQDRRGNQ